MTSTSDCIPSFACELLWQRGPGNPLDVTVWHGSAESDLLFPAENNFIPPIGTYTANINFMEWSRHYLTQGREREEPPAQVAQLIEWYDQVIVESDPAVRDQLMYNILRSQAKNLWAIGTIGEAPYPIIVYNAMRNGPTDRFWGWETHWTTNRDPEQFFFDRLMDKPTKRLALSQPFGTKIIRGQPASFSYWKIVTQGSSRKHLGCCRRLAESASVLENHAHIFCS